MRINSSYFNTQKEKENDLQKEDNINFSKNITHSRKRKLLSTHCQILQ